MIKRHYFYHAKWNHNDGRLSHSFVCGTLTYTSWRVNSGRVYSDVVDHVRSLYKEKYPNGTVEVTCVSRL